MLWTLWLARPYLDLDPAVVPNGREYLSAIQANMLWVELGACGACATWYGHVSGGLPALADPLSSALHPLVMATTVGWGITGGAKLAMIGAFFMGGLAQWWLARVLGLGLVARVWGGAMGVAAGHIVSRTELGAFGLVLSTAACALTLAPMVALSQSGSRRDAVLLGVVLAAALVSGNGYMQATLLLLLPVTLVLVLGQGDARGPLLRRYALAGGLAVLLAAPFLVPFLHFLPNFAKDTDPGFQAAQPLAYVPLNLVIADRAFFDTNALGKLPYLSHYGNFVGWVPVVLAVWTVFGSGAKPAPQRLGAL